MVANFAKLPGSGGGRAEAARHQDARSTLRRSQDDGRLVHN
jgi:hypothetical protein